MLSTTIVSDRYAGSAIQKTASRKPSLSVCTHCHDSDIGGKHLKLESLTALSGLELDLTHAPYHLYAAELARPHNQLSLQLLSPQGKRLASEPVRFTWAKGSFWVTTTPAGRLVMALDEIAHQNNIRVTTRPFRVVLNASSNPL